MPFRDFRFDRSEIVFSRVGMLEGKKRRKDNKRSGKSDMNFHGYLLPPSPIMRQAKKKRILERINLLYSFTQ